MISIGIFLLADFILMVGFKMRQIALRSISIAPQTPPSSSRRPVTEQGEEAVSLLSSQPPRGSAPSSQGSDDR